MAEPSQNGVKIAINKFKTFKRRIGRIKWRCQQRVDRCEVERELADKTILWGLAI
jgi:hypothetical protein